MIEPTKSCWMEAKGAGVSARAQDERAAWGPLPAFVYLERVPDVASGAVVVAEGAEGAADKRLGLLMPRPGVGQVR